MHTLEHPCDVGLHTAKLICFMFSGLIKIINRVLKSSFASTVLEVSLEKEEDYVNSLLCRIRTALE